MYMHANPHLKTNISTVMHENVNAITLNKRTCTLYICLVNYCMKCNLQNMYEEGDPEMKRTVAKAWTEAKFGRNP